MYQFWHLGEAYHNQRWHSLRHFRHVLQHRALAVVEVAVAELL
jgi:hypothetical protein